MKTKVPSAVPTSLANLRQDPDRLLSQKEAAPFRGGSVKTLERDRWAGQGIPYLKLGRRVVYRAQDIIDWIEAQRIDTTKCAA